MMKRLNSILVLVFTASLFFSCASLPRQSVYVPPEYWPTEDWRTTTPEEQGVSSSLLSEAVNALLQESEESLHSFIIIKNGYIITEYYAPGYDRTTLNNLHSSTKSFTGGIIGAAESQGLLKRDDTVISFFPDLEFERKSRLREKVTIEDLLTMSSGMQWAEYYNHSRSELSIGNPTQIEDWTAFILNQPYTKIPGTTFQYNSMNSHLLMGILDAVTSGNSKSFLDSEFFAPMGITGYYWASDSENIPFGFWGLHLTTRDMAKLGYLYLNYGHWDDQQIFSEEWAETATESQIPAEGPFDYGYQLWTEPNGFYAKGFGGQYILNFKYENVICVFTGESSYILENALQRFFPLFFKSIVSNQTINNDDTGQETLLKTLNKQSEPITQIIPEEISEVIGVEYVFPEQSYFLERKTNENIYQDPVINLRSITIKDIEFDTLKIQFQYKDQNYPDYLTVLYEVGLDGQARYNPCQEHYLAYMFNYPMWVVQYPEPDMYDYAIKGTFSGGNTLNLDIKVIGSPIIATWSLSFENTNLHARVQQHDSEVELIGSSEK